MLGKYATAAALQLGDFKVSRHGLDGGKGVKVGGHMAATQVTQHTGRGKKRASKEVAPGADIFPFTPNAEQMTQLGSVRWLRLQMVRGCAFHSPCVPPLLAGWRCPA